MGSVETEVGAREVTKAKPKKLGVVVLVGTGVVVVLNGTPGVVVDPTMLPEIVDINPLFEEELVKLAEIDGAITARVGLDAVVGAVSPLILVLEVFQPPTAVLKPLRFPVLLL